MNEIEKAIAIIEGSQAIGCACKYCEADRWAYELAIAALREKAQRKEPTADVAPVVRGEWIGYTTSAFAGVDDCGEPKWTPRKFFRCSHCRRGTAVKEKYCPSCGARMEGDRS